MTQAQTHTEGIVLRITKYGEGDQIASLFTADHGLIKLIVKGGLSIRRKQASPLSPLTRVEVLYKNGKSELHVCTEATPLERFQREEQSYAQLEAACLLARAIDQSQLLEKPAPQLYALLITYLRGLQHSPQCDAWVSSFWLKILKHDGLLDTLEHCTACSEVLVGACIAKGECYCPAHRPLGAQAFSADELTTLQRLLHARSTQVIAETVLTRTLTEKVRVLFEQCIDIPNSRHAR
jgi:DNA repair protein RecO (recombination protein O)